MEEDNVETMTKTKDNWESILLDSALERSVQSEGRKEGRRSVIEREERINGDKESQTVINDKNYYKV